MASRYLKLDPESAYLLKKDIKSSEEIFNSISQKINGYKLLRKKEIILKNKLKITLTSLRTKIDYMESTFPAEERKSIGYSMLEKEKQERKLQAPLEKVQITNPPINEKKIDVSQDLEEIRKTLERFN